MKHPFPNQTISNWNFSRNFVNQIFLNQNVNTKPIWTKSVLIEQVPFEKEVDANHFELFLNRTFLNQIF